MKVNLSSKEPCILTIYQRISKSLRDVNNLRLPYFSIVILFIVVFYIFLFVCCSFVCFVSLVYCVATIILCFVPGPV